MRKHEPILAVALVGAALVLAACGTERPTAGGGGTPGSTESSSASPSRTTSTPMQVTSGTFTQVASGTPAHVASSRPGPSHAPSSHRPQSRAPGRCHTSELAATVTMRDSAAGHRHAWLVLANRSGTTCTVYGYGGMQLYRSNGAPVPTRMVRDPAVPPRLLTLAPDTSVRASLSWTVVPTGGEPATRACEPTATTAHVTPPDETSYDSIPWRFGEVCNRGTIDEGAFR